MRVRTIVGLVGLATLIGIGVYLLVQIPWEYGVFGLLALLGIYLLLAHEAPAAE